jgi:hypothetical protein
VLGIHEIGQYIQLWHGIDHTLLTDKPDRLQWRWTANGIYSAKSCYLTTFHGSTTSRSWKLLWKSWAPPRVRFEYQGDRIKNGVLSSAFKFTAEEISSI